MRVVVFWSTVLPGSLWDTHSCRCSLPRGTSLPPSLSSTQPIGSQNRVESGTNDGLTTRSLHLADFSELLDSRNCKTRDSAQYHENGQTCLQQFGFDPRDRGDDQLTGRDHVVDKPQLVTRSGLIGKKGHRARE